MKPQKTARGNPKPREASPEAQAKESDRKFIETAMKRWRFSAEFTAETRRESLDDFKFAVLSEQWPQAVVRKFGNKVRLTINRVMAFVGQVCNEQRAQRPAGTINPVGDQSDKDTAEILQGLIRHIDVNCDSEVADDIAFEHMVIGGQGWLRLWSEYIDDDPDNEWEQEIKVGAVPNPFTVYDDPSARHPLKIDAKWRFFVEDLAIDEYKERYGDKTDFASLEQFRSTGDSQGQWVGKEMIRIAEYYHIEYDKETIYQLADGSTVRSLADLPKGASVMHTREKQTPKVMWTLMNAVQKLEEHKVPGSIIPSIPVLGYTQNVDGKQYIAGLVRNAKDPARAYNYQLSKATQAVAIAPTMPFVIAEGQAEGHEAEWRNANTGDLAALTYKPISSGGQPVGPPQRQTAEPPIQAISHLLLTADTDMKAVTGLFDPSLGQKSPDQSGKAIVALQRQGNVATSNFSDNLARTKREMTRLMLKWIPVIYDAAAVRRIIKPDGTVDHVGVYNSKTTGMSQQDAQAHFADAMEAGKIKKIYDIGVGRYDVTVSVGPSYQTKRQEQAASIMQLIGAYPELMHVCGDILINDLDFEQAKEIAERVKRTIPPNILGPADGTDPEADNARMQAELQQLMQQHQQLATELSQATQVIQQKQIEAKSKLDAVKLQEETKVTVAEINTKAQDAQARFQWTIDQWKILHDSAHDVGMQAQDAANDQQAAQQQQGADQQSQASDQAHQAQQATQAQAAAQQAQESQESQSAQ